MTEKILFLKLQLEKLSISHIAGLFDQIYLWIESIDLMDSLYLDRLPENENI